MHNKREITKINSFLSLKSSSIACYLKMLLLTAGLLVKEEGHGPDLAFSIQSGEKEAKFYLQNLLLEIATRDRDEEPLRFDERLRDFDFFAAKTAHLIESKLKILFKLFEEEGVEAALESVSQYSREYERIRIWWSDQEKPGPDQQP